MLPAVVLLATALAAEQSLTVRVEGVAPGMGVEAVHGELGRLRLVDAGGGRFVGTFRGPYARFARLRVETVGGGTTVVWEGRVATPDAAGETVTLRMEGSGAVRVPSPAEPGPFRIPVDAAAVAWGWAGAALGAVGLLVIAGDRSRR